MMSIVSAARLLFSCPLLLGFARYCGATTERVDDLGVPILNKDDRSADMPDNDGADAIVRRVHGGWYLVYRPPRDTHETPIAMRMQTMYWKVHASVIAATKNTNMLDPIIQPDGTYRTPTYRLSDEQIDALYEDELELWEYRACALASGLYGWLEESIKDYTRDPGVADMESYLLQLGLPPADERTNLGAIFVADAFPNFQCDVTAPCTKDTMMGSLNKGNGKSVYRSPQCIGEGIRERIRLFRCNDGWNECGTDRNTGQLERDNFFRETIGYYPTHMANYGGNRRNWAPITECKQGYCSSQDFVTVHVGFTARTYFMNEAEIYEIVNSVVRPLQVDYKFELRKVLDEMEAVAVDPFYKTKIATHDNKFLYADAFGQILGQNDNTWDEIAYWANAFLSVEYEGLVMNWRAKALNDHVRPTTVAQELLGDEIIASWQLGVDESKEYPARAWHPYIRCVSLFCRIRDHS